MPRIRTIKPEFWTDKKILRLSRDARLLFIGLWNFADDNGVIEADPLQLKVRIFPADPDITDETIQRLLDEMKALDLIREYEYEGERYIWIVNFTKHQKIDRPRKSNLPLPEEVVNGSQKTSTEIQSSSDDQKNFQLKSVEINPGKGKEKDQGKEGIKDQGREGKENLRSANALRVPAANAATTLDDPGPKKSPPSCPYQEIVRLYHEILPELPQCRVLNETRKRFIRTRWREVLTKPDLMAIMVPEHEELLMYSDRQKGLLWFERLFRYVSESEFLLGQVPPNGRNQSFMADLEWLMRPTNFAKVLEGKYHRSRASPHVNPKAHKTAMAAMELLQEYMAEEARNGMEQ